MWFGKGIVRYLIKERIIMLSKKIRSLSAVIAAAVICAMPVSAHTHVDDLPADYSSNIQPNKPYMNFGVKAGAGTDISKLKFAVKDSSGRKVAEFTGSNGALNILDESLYDLSGIHSLDDLKNSKQKSRIPYDVFVPDKMKGVEPGGKLMNGKNRKSASYSDYNYYIRLEDECYYYYNDINKMTVVDTITVPANTIYVEIDSKFPDLNDKRSYLRLNPYDNGQSCELKGDYKLGEHAGEKKYFKADTGNYEVISSGGHIAGEHCEVYNKPVRYSKVRMKFNDAFPGFASADLKVKDGSDREYDLRGDQSRNTFTALYYSGSVISAPIPDKDGYVEFWVSNETPGTKMEYNYSWRNGGGGGSVKSAKLPKSIEDLNFVFEYPQAGYCLYNVKPENYTLYIDDKGDRRDYSLDLSELKVTNTKKIQRFTITVDKKPLLLGDCNRDGKVNATDVIVLAAHVKGKKILDGRGPEAADVNESGSVNISDVIILAAHVKGRKILPKKYI